MRSPTHNTAFALALLSAVALLAPDADAQNVARGKSAFQSSSYGGPTSNASKAVDGNTNGNYSAGSVAATFNDFNAWWYVDLGATFDIDSIALWNRTDCCGNRLANFFVSVLAAGTSNVSAPNAATVWTQLFGGTAGVHEVFMPGGVQGQYVKVQYNSHANYLQLAEVEVTPVVVSTTPEPANLALVASGLLAFGGVSQLRKKTR